MRIGFGVITCQRHPDDPRTQGEIYNDAIELACEAERLGFDAVWLSEHHFVDDGYLSSSMVLAGAIASRTTRVEIGTALLLAPFHDPLRLAEDTATADLISGGRLVLGVGQGWRDEEFDAFGLTKRDGPKRLRASIRVLKEGWSSGLVDGPGVSVTPKPARPGGPPIWVGGFQEKAVRRAVTIGDGYLGPRGVPEIFAEEAAWIRDELAVQKRDPASFRLGLLAPVFVWKEDPAWEVVRPYQHFVTWKYDNMRDAKGQTGPLPPVGPFEPADESRLRSMVMAGTPDEVASQLARYEEVAGREIDLIARMYWPGMDPSMQREAMRIFASEVIPKLRT